MLCRVVRRASSNVLWQVSVHHSKSACRCLQSAAHKRSHRPPIVSNSIRARLPGRVALCSTLAVPIVRHTATKVGQMRVKGLPMSQTLSLSLWSDCCKEVYDSLHTPFAIALAQGCLPRSTFQHYVEQDAYFLQSFAQAYALALAKGADVPKDQFQAIVQLLQGVHEELGLHRSYAQQWGVALHGANRPSPATTAYTDFLLSVARDEQSSVAHILAAMLPCSRLYGFIGCQLAAAYPDASHEYSDWIRTYSSPAYLALPALKEQLLDELGKEVPYSELLQLYRRALQLEVDFFCAQPGTPPPRDVGLFVTDFDDTISQGDTIGGLMSASAERAGQVKGQAAKAELEALVTKLGDNYMQRYGQLLAQLLPAASEDAGQPGRAYDGEGLLEFLARLSAFDVEMNQVVVDSGVLKGLDRDGIQAAAQKVPLRQGCIDALRRVLRRGLPVHVVSLNWSADYVAAALGSLPCHFVTSNEARPTTAPVYITANQLETSESGEATGRLLARVQCAADKDREFEQLLASCGAGGGGRAAATNANGGHSSGEATGSGRCSVYVGDSVSDLPPMLKADYGVVIGQSKTLRRVCSQFGVRLAPLCAAPLHPQHDTSCAVPTLYEAADWDEVASFVLGPSTGAVPAWQLQQQQQQQPTGAAAAGTAGAAAPRVPRVLIVAGSDSGGGAGIQADLKTCTARGVFGMTAVTALTAQNTHGVHGVHVTPIDFLTQQMDCVLQDLGADVVKTGMLPTPEAVAATAEAVRRHGVPWLVVDPVLVSTSGHSLAGSAVVAAMRQHLLPIAGVLTPNVPEASALLGGMAINTLEDMQEAAKQLHQLGPRYVLIKGGHLLTHTTPAAAAGDGRPPQPPATANGDEQPSLPPPPAKGDSRPLRSQAVDVLYDGRSLLMLREDAVDTPNTHGTGCTLASAIAAELAKGVEPVAAVQQAKRYLTSALEHSKQLRLGNGRQTPFNHGFEIADWAASRRPPARPPLDLRVYAVTDANCNARMGRSLVEAVSLALEGGATILQLREKHLDGGDFLEETLQVMQVARRYGVPVIINDRVDVALATDADGVHVGQSDLPAALVRRMLGPGKLLGVSAKTKQQALQAQADGADYVGVGAVYPTTTKDSSAIGLEALAEICSGLLIPVVAIGGISATNAAAAVTAGAAGVAVVSAVFGTVDAALATRALRQAVVEALAARPSC